MKTCLVIEDQAPAQRILERYIQDIGNLKLVGIYTDALSALAFLKDNPVDLIFLDIHLPKISGIDFLQVLSPQPPVIFTTAFPDYALQGYELDVVDYLLKPFSFERFVKAVSKVLYKPNIPPTAVLSPSNDLHEEEFLFVKVGKDHQRIEVAQIQFIKSDGDYTHLFLADKKHLVSQPLRYWITTLNAKYFCQVHKSYLVNVSRIQRVSGNQVYIGVHKLPIGRTYRESFFTNYL